ncbi:hypothetical protein GCM10009609_12650 [Pseudonocardia aurantiaca]
MPSVSVNSFGGYEASVPNTRRPSDAIGAGTIAASASSFATAGAGALGAAPPDVPPPLPSPPAPQPATMTASAAAPRTAGIERDLTGTVDLLVGGEYAGMLPSGRLEDTCKVVTVV